MAGRKLKLSLKHKIELIEEVEKKEKKQKINAEEFVSVNTKISVTKPPLTRIELLTQGLMLSAEEVRGKFIISEEEGKGRGVFLKEATIKKGAFVLEYEGEVISSKEAKKRERFYAGNGEGCFIMDFKYEGKKMAIDATRTFDSYARLLNHSKKPNIRFHAPIVVDAESGKPRIAAYALRDIKRGEEIQFDYGVKSSSLPWLKNRQAGFLEMEKDGIDDNDTQSVSSTATQDNGIRLRYTAARAGREPGKKPTFKYTDGHASSSSSSLSSEEPSQISKTLCPSTLQVKLRPCTELNEFNVCGIKFSSLGNGNFKSFPTSINAPQTIMKCVEESSSPRKRRKTEESRSTICLSDETASTQPKESTDESMVFPDVPQLTSEEKVKNWQGSLNIKIVGVQSLSDSPEHPQSSASLPTSIGLIGEQKPADEKAGIVSPDFFTISDSEEVEAGEMTSKISNCVKEASVEPNDSRCTRSKEVLKNTLEVPTVRSAINNSKTNHTLVKETHSIAPVIDRCTHLTTSSRACAIQPQCLKSCEENKPAPLMTQGEPPALPTKHSHVREQDNLIILDVEDALGTPSELIHPSHDKNLNSSVQRLKPDVTTTSLNPASSSHFHNYSLSTEAANKLSPIVIDCDAIPSPSDHFPRSTSAPLNISHMGQKQPSRGVGDNTTMIDSENRLQTQTHSTLVQKADKYSDPPFKHLAASSNNYRHTQLQGPPAKNPMLNKGLCPRREPCHPVLELSSDESDVEIVSTQGLYKKKKTVRNIGRKLGSHSLDTQRDLPLRDSFSPNNEHGGPIKKVAVIKPLCMDKPHEDLTQEEVRQLSRIFNPHISSPNVSSDDIYATIYKNWNFFKSILERGITMDQIRTAVKLYFQNINGC